MNTLQVRCAKTHAILNTDGLVDDYGNMRTFANGKSAGNYQVRELDVYIPFLCRWVDLATAIWDSYIIVSAYNNYIKLEVPYCSTARNRGLFPAKKFWH